MTTLQGPIDLQAFVAEDPNHPFKKGQVDPQAGPTVLAIVKDLLGLPTDKHLQRLLGVPDGLNYVYRWKKGKNRMSQLYQSRAFALLYLYKHLRHNLSKIRSIDWELGEPEFYEEHDGNSALFSEIRRYLQTNSSTTRTRVAQLPKSSQEPPGHQLRSQTSIHPKQTNLFSND